MNITYQEALRAFGWEHFVVHSQLLAYIIWTTKSEVYVGERNILAREYSLESEASDLYLKGNIM